MNLLSHIAYALLLILLIPLPVGTDQRRKALPFITYGLICVNMLVYFVICAPAIGSQSNSDLFLHWGVIPRSPNVVCLFTSMFLHVSVPHLLWNMAFLWLFGPNGEEALGHAPFLIFYLAGGIAAGLMHLAIVILFADNASVAYAPLVGASGAVSAVVGLYAVRFYRSRLRFYWLAAGFVEPAWAFLKAPALAGLGIWFLQNLFGGILALFQPNLNGIAYWAHIGGFVFGIVAAELTDMVGEAMREYMFMDAHKAVAGGEEGVRDAARKYRLLLQRRPDDIEVKQALAKLSRGTDVIEGPAETRRANNAVVDAYTALLETALINQDRDQARQWEQEIERLGGYSLLGARTGFRLAARYARAGEHAKAGELFRTFSERFPMSPEAERGTLDAALVYLDDLNRPDIAVQILRPLINSGIPLRAPTISLRIQAGYHQVRLYAARLIGDVKPTSESSEKSS